MGKDCPHRSWRNARVSARFLSAAASRALSRTAPTAMMTSQATKPTAMRMTAMKATVAFAARASRGMKGNSVQPFGGLGGQRALEPPRVRL